MKKTKVFFNRCLDKGDVVHINNGILLSIKYFLMEGIQAQKLAGN